MDKLNKIIDIPVNLEVEQIDTDQIIPARYLKRTERKGFGKFLFYDWRFDKAGNPINSFVLNQVQHKRKILIAGTNFGCGSSREHAAWALYDYGFRVIIATFFADIFKENALNNGILPIQISNSFYELLMSELSLDKNTKLAIDLEKQEVKLLVSNEKEKFEISPYKKNCLQNGMDDLSYLVHAKQQIKEFEKSTINYENI